MIICLFKKKKKKIHVPYMRSDEKKDIQSMAQINSKLQKGSHQITR